MLSFTASSARTFRFTLSRIKYVVTGVLFALSLILSAQPVAAVSVHRPSPTPAMITRAPGVASRPLPLSFEPNLGQADPGVRYLAHGAGYTLFLTESGAVLRLRAPQ